jgi:predicted MFS family arabinose efflux permease
MKLFAAGSVISIVMVIIYTNLPPSPLWTIIIINMFLFMGIMSRIVPSQAINTSIPETADRGAYMSITSSMQQLAGGIAAVCAGYIVYQPSKFAPLQHYDTLGIVISCVTLTSIFLMARVNRIANRRKPVTEVGFMSEAM